MPTVNYLEKWFLLLRRYGVFEREHSLCVCEDVLIFDMGKSSLYGHIIGINSTVTVTVIVVK